MIDSDERSVNVPARVAAAAAILALEAEGVEVIAPTHAAGEPQGAVG